MIELCEELITLNGGFFSIATLWFKRRKELLDLQYFPKIETWLYTYITNWGQCDQFCYRILSPFVYKFPDLYENVLEWTGSEKIYVKRAAAVSLIKSSGQSFAVDYELSKVLNVVSILRNDQHHHIQKAIGWVLKYAYLSYPEEIIEYLKENRDKLSRTTFRYGLEKVPKDLRIEMMGL